MTRHRISPTRDGKLLVIGPYDPDFVDAIKRGVPASARTWMPIAKAWKVDAEFRRAVEQAIEECDG